MVPFEIRPPDELGPNLSGKCSRCGLLPLRSQVSASSEAAIRVRKTGRRADQADRQQTNQTYGW